jgi:hypothetical protein
VQHQVRSCSQTNAQVHIEQGNQHMMRRPHGACCIAALIAVSSLGLIMRAQAQTTVPQIDILQEKGCTVGTALVPNMQDCVVDEVMGSNGTVSFTFNVGPKAKHSLLLTLRSVGGAAVM